ncbi:MAG: hypothetical protein ACYDBP_07810, partial [Leptospirales bacterium]
RYECVEEHGFKGAGQCAYSLAQYRPPSGLAGTSSAVHGGVVDRKKDLPAKEDNKETFEPSPSTRLPKGL